ncbi:hypothetical protein [Streptomyces sp. NPDC002962]|uniref:hypothetical protein n=1 Tax=Streptomyces sp. NPDC002962 TaxID=3364674 RepID=UPI0036CDDE93
MQRADLRVYPDDVPHEGLPGDLVGAADYIAGAVQRPAITRPPIMNGTDTVSVQLTALALADTADPAPLVAHQPAPTVHPVRRGLAPRPCRRRPGPVPEADRISG